MQGVRKCSPRSGYFVYNLKEVYELARQGLLGESRESEGRYNRQLPEVCCSEHRGGGGGGAEGTEYEKMGMVQQTRDM